MKSTGQRKWQQGEYNHLARKKKKSKTKMQFHSEKNNCKKKNKKNQTKKNRTTQILSLITTLSFERIMHTLRST